MTERATGLRLATHDEHVDLASCLAIQAAKAGVTAVGVATTLLERFRGPVFHLSRVESMAISLVDTAGVVGAARRETVARIKAICAEIEGWVPLPTP